MHKRLRCRGQAEDTYEGGHTGLWSNLSWIYFCLKAHCIKSFFKWNKILPERIVIVMIVRNKGGLKEK